MKWRIFKTRRFAREAIAQGLTDEALKKAVSEIQKGLAGSALGGYLIKKRIAVGSKGKSGGLRTILAYKTPSDKLFCIYVFAKNKQDNIGTAELKALKILAA